jgi:hypothetical protein
MTLIKTVAVDPGKKPLHIEMTPEEEAAFLSRQEASAAAQPRLDIIDKIQKLESSITSRMLRDAALGTDISRLQNIENQISQLRSQL